VPQKTLVIASKRDITPECAAETVCENAKAWGAMNTVQASHTNVENVVDTLCKYYDNLSKTEFLEHTTILISTRQRDNTQNAAKFLRDAARVAKQGGYPESVASLVLAGKNEMEEIVGIIAVDDVLENLFSHFCIGK
jgi:tRNA U34 5-carboxymethylaminomethyl modifying GTPase MnmE/TrmE